MRRLLKYEFLKLNYSRSFKVMIFLSVLFGFASSGISFALSQESITYGYEAFFQQFIELRALLFVFAGVFSGMFIGEDFSSRSVQSEIASGYSRFSILLSKTIAYMVGVCVLLIIQVLIGTLAATIINGFGVPLSAEVLGNMLRAVFMFMFLTCACSMVYVMTSFCLKHVGTTIAVNMLLLVIIDGLFQAGAMISNTGMKIYEATPFVQMLISSSETISAGPLLKAISIGAATSLVFFVLAHAFFYKTELK